jgi:hypothetical protein
VSILGRSKIGTKIVEIRFIGSFKIILNVRKCLKGYYKTNTVSIIKLKGDSF